MTEEFSIGDLIRDAVNGLGSLLHGHNKDLINVLRQPTPLNLSTVLTANAAGVIGGGLTSPNPETIWQCPESHEAWINRIMVHQVPPRPGTPLTTGQAMCTGSTVNETIFFLPLGGVIAPVLITEGRLSAAQLNSGERMLFAADGLPANTQLKIELQIVLVTGMSPDTPKDPHLRLLNVNVVD
jgi:hypothetical protein